MYGRPNPLMHERRFCVELPLLKVRLLSTRAAPYVIVVVPPVGSVIEVGREKGSVKVTEVVAPLASVAEVSKPA